MFGPGKLNSIITFALKCSLFDRISDGNGVQKISTYYDYVTVNLHKAEEKKYAISITE